MADNQVHFVGNATREPTLTYTGGGQAVTKFGLAVNRKWKQNDEWKEAVTFVDVTAWGALAENVAGSAKKGDRIMVSGRLDQNNYEDKDGNKRTGFQVTADEIGLSLRYATGTADRTERKASSNDGFNQDPGGDTRPF